MHEEEQARENNSVEQNKKLDMGIDIEPQRETNEKVAETENFE